MGRLKLRFKPESVNDVAGLKSQAKNPEYLQACRLGRRHNKSQAARPIETKCAGIRERDRTMRW